MAEGRSPQAHAREAGKIFPLVLCHRTAGPETTTTTADATLSPSGFTPVEQRFGNYEIPSAERRVYGTPVAPPTGFLPWTAGLKTTVKAQSRYF
ncbi:MAG TPA: hypothetical protein PLY87_05480 [Planctomycetaceae bacterium]|nr:hypothetical protein [Planctomycetaceae bacterium]